MLHRFTISITITRRAATINLMVIGIGMTLYPMLVNKIKNSTCILRNISVILDNLGVAYSVTNTFAFFNDCTYLILIMAVHCSAI